MDLKVPCGNLERQQDLPTSLLYKIQSAIHGNHSNGENYRGVTLLPIPGKVLNRIILSRVKELVSIQLHSASGAARWISQRQTDPVLKS